jgi:DNA-binding transcriptional ArsR family regulator
MSPKENPSLKLNARLVRVGSHPTKSILMTILHERVASQKELAELTGESIGSISHHMRELKKDGLVEVVDERQRRGAVEYFYRATLMTILGDEDMAALTLEERQAFGAMVVQLIMGDFSRSASTGLLSRRSNTHLTRNRQAVDEQGWDELTKAMRLAMDTVFEIEERSAARLAESGEDPISSCVGLLHFQTPGPWPPTPSDAER